MSQWMKHYFYTKNLFTIAENEEGQSLAEYGLILALIAVVCIAAVTALGGEIASYLEELQGAFAGG
ncbi:MAG: Flp family type IVb pilin [Caldilineaceae bacterium]|nr:Flp family type IVb pilin [Caldilineaceae bacterium]HRJ45212.1 Flp family type IVb pilin [Caldilineaceae bacterium]